ncbi:unnamed protein product [Rodentolepis nana]|uniref:Uncharacterized protein n=1 Tax=Rodentolepis nana TaxID=102285 RepID=A0A0R3T2K7_RODNA|nr:unnamed protein product [Rodentolepis nana]
MHPGASSEMFESRVAALISNQILKSSRNLDHQEGIEKPREEPSQRLK